MNPRTRHAPGLLVLALSLPALAESQSWADHSQRALAVADCGKAIEYLNKGLEGQETDAVGLAGMLYSRGVCLQRDPDKALAMLGLATRFGHAPSAAELVLMHGLGRGAPQDYAEAGRWAIAAMDILNLSRSKPAGGAESCGEEALDVARASGVGYLATVHLRAAELLKAPDLSSLAPGRPLIIEVGLRLAEGKPTVEMTRFKRSAVGALVAVEGRAAARSAIDALESAYQRAASEVPPAPRHIVVEEPFNRSFEFFVRD